MKTPVSTAVLLTLTLTLTWVTWAEVHVHPLGHWNGGFSAEIALRAPFEMDGWRIRVVFSVPVPNIEHWADVLMKLCDYEYIFLNTSYNGHLPSGLDFHVTFNSNSSGDLFPEICAYFEGAEPDSVCPRPHEAECPQPTGLPPITAVPATTATTAGATSATTAEAASSPGSATSATLQPQSNPTPTSEPVATTTQTQQPPATTTQTPNTVTSQPSATTQLPTTPTPQPTTATPEPTPEAATTPEPTPAAATTTQAPSDTTPVPATATTASVGSHTTHPHVSAAIDSTTATAASTPTSGDCNDIDANCWSRPDSSCLGIYEPWARANCALRCGYCHAPPCEDAIPNCERYGNNTCTDPGYSTWARTNCRKFCNMCAVLPTVSGPVYPNDCDFDSGVCTWVNSTAGDDQFDWTLNHGTTPSGGTGPTTDHTLQIADGMYIYIETSAGSTGDAARLESPVLSANQTYCLKFWYHLFGTSIGSVSVRTRTGGVASDAIWSQNGPSEDQWKQASVEVPAGIATPFQFIIEGVRGSSYLGDAAIDDIQLRESACSS